MDYYAAIIALSLFLFWFSPDIGRAFRSWNEGRNKRLLKEQDHKQEMEKLAAEKEFDRKLRLTTKSNQKILSEFEYDDITFDEKSQMRK